MTEEEAKKKWCPMVRKIGWKTETCGGPWGYGFGYSYNRPSEDNALCIGFACMMWREKEENCWCGLGGSDGLR